MAADSWSWIRAESAAGIIARIVGCCSRSNGSSSWASVLRATTTRPPTESMASVQRNEPMCDIEEPGRKTSSGSSSKAAAALAIIQRRVSRVWVTPLAGPVLPEVKKIAAGPAGSSGGCPPGSGSLANSASKLSPQSPSGSPEISSAP